MKKGTLLLGIVTGIAAGVLGGFLFAPKKGKDTRKKISQQSKEYADSLKEKFNEVIEGISDKLETINLQGSDLTKKAHSKSNGL